MCSTFTCEPGLLATRIDLPATAHHTQQWSSSDCASIKTKAVTAAAAHGATGRLTLAQLNAFMADCELVASTATAWTAAVDAAYGRCFGVLLSKLQKIKPTYAVHAHCKVIAVPVRAEAVQATMRAVLQWPEKTV
jgi:hypothetical protein